MEKLSTHFSAEDVEVISNLCLSVNSCDDLLVWFYDSKREFSVKSGYHLALELDSAESPSASSSDNNRKFWKKLWNLNLPKKIMIFLWRSCHRAIPTHQALFKRSIVPDLICPICRNQVDTVQHALIYCKQAKMVWKKTDFANKLYLRGEIDFTELLNEVLENNTSAEEFVSIAWSIWFARNSALHEQKSFTVDGTIQRGLKLLEAFVQAQLKDQTVISSRADPPTAELEGEQIPAGFFRLNVDASVSKDNKKFGWGMVIRNDSGIPVFAAHKGGAGLPSILEAEAKSLLWGLSTAIDHNFLPLEVVSDNKVLISLMEGSILNRFGVELIIQNINERLLETRGVSLK